MILGSLGGMVIPLGRSGATGLYWGGELAGGLEFRVLLTSACLRQARFLQIVLKNWFL